MPRNRCLVISCKKESGHIYRIPELQVVGPEVRKKWLEVINDKRKYQVDVAKTTYGICQNHFTIDSFVPASENKDNKGRQKKIMKLLPNAVPTILDYSPEHAAKLQEIQKEIKKNTELKENTKSVEKSFTIKERPYKCPHCETKFTHYRNMKRHISTVHEGCRDFKCGDCQQSFGSKQVWQRHCESLGHNFESLIYLKSESGELELEEQQDYCQYETPIIPHESYEFSTKKFKFESPWDVNSLYEFQYFNCPSCAYKDNSRQEFLNHAYKFHPESLQYLSNIKDSSMSDLTIPMVFLKEEKDDTSHLQESHQNLLNLKNESNNKDPLFMLMVQCYYCSQEMDQRIVKTHVEKSHPSKPVKFNILKDVASIPKDDKKEIIESIKDELIDYESDSVNEKELGNEDVLVESTIVQCYYCEIELVHSEIKNHIEEQHPSEEVVCVPIGKMIEENETDKKSQNNTTISDPEFHQKCLNCSKTFRQEARLRKHQEMCGKNKLKCDYCEEKFSFYQNLRTHILDFHECHKCDMCEQEFTNPSTLNSHKLKVHEGLNCKTCGRLFKKAYELKSHIKRIHEGRKEHMCTTCNKSFFKPTELKRHITEVHGPDPVCEECGKSFSSSSYLKYHIQTIHKGQGHVCDICEKSFNIPSDLRDHKETVHDGRRDIVCHLCGKLFTHKHSMRNHVRWVHEGKKDYKCDSCGKLYSQKRNMLNHIATVHEGRKLENKNQREYQCPTCGKIFFKKNTLITHTLDIHEGRKHDCKHCDKSFTSNGTLRQHIKHIHEGVPHRNRKK